MLELAMSPAPDQKQHSIILYRESRTRITVAVNTVIEQENRTKEEVKIRIINTQDDVFIPYYAFQQLDAQVDASPTVSLGYDGGASMVAHNLMCEDDVRKLQHALTEYEPVANLSKVRFKIALNEFSLRPRSIEGEGRVQIWRWEQMSAESNTAGHALTSPASSNTSPGYSAFSTASDDTMQQIQQVMNTVGRDNVTVVQNASEETIISTKRIHPPVLVIFTTLEKKLTILHCQRKHHFPVMW